MTSRRGRRHSVMVPEMLWRKFQWRSGLTNPGPYIRECLFDWIGNEEEQESLMREYQAQQPAAETDKGHVAKLRYQAVCEDCGLLLRPGEEAVLVTVQGKRIYRHPEHLALAH